MSNISFKNKHLIICALNESARCYNQAYLKNVSVDSLIVLQFRFTVVLVTPDHQIHEVWQEVFWNVRGTLGASLHVVLKHILDIV